MNILDLVLFVLLGVVRAQENFSVTTTEQAVPCGNFDKESKTLEVKNKIATETQDCLFRYFSVDDIKTRVEIGRNNDVLDIVSEEFCLVKSIVQRCVNRSLLIENPCFGDDEQQSFHLILDITKSVLNFVCYKHGDRILLFLTEGGFECIESKTNKLEKCINKFLGDSNLIDINSVNFYEQINNVTICESYTKLQKCVFDILNVCTNPTPANMVNLLFEHIKSFTTCGNLKNHTTVE